MGRQLQSFWLSSLSAPPCFPWHWSCSRRREHQPCSLWAGSKVIPHAWSAPQGGHSTALWETPSGPWQGCWHGPGVGWSECSLLFLPPKCFHSVRSISVPSPAHTCARAQRWLGIVRSTKTAAGRGGQTWPGQTVI